MWEADAAEMAESGRDVISLYISSSESAREPDSPAGIAEAIQSALYPLDERWTAKIGRLTTPIRRDNAFYLELHNSDALRLVSSGTADLFGVTPATEASLKLFELVQDTRDIEALRLRLQQLHAPAIIAYGKLVAALSKLRASVTFALATAAGGRSEAELSVSQLQEACSFMEETQVTALLMRVRGQLTDWHPAGRSFQLEADDGRRFTGRPAREVRQQYGVADTMPKLPVFVEALIERRTTYQVRIDTETVVDLLMELDTDPGISREETLHQFRKQYNRLRLALEQEDGHEDSVLVSAADYGELAELMHRLVESNPLKGARLALDSGDLADAKALLAETRPIGRLALAEGNGYDGEADDTDGGEPSPASRAVRLKAIADRQKLAAAAYGDIVKLASRLSNMIAALEGEAPNR